jgi:hypothetical protein
MEETAAGNTKSTEIIYSNKKVVIHDEILPGFFRFTLILFFEYNRSNG